MLKFLSSLYTDHLIPYFVDVSVLYLRRNVNQRLLLKWVDNDLHSWVNWEFGPSLDILPIIATCDGIYFPSAPAYAMLVSRKQKRSSYVQPCFRRERGKKICSFGQLKCMSGNETCAWSFSTILSGIVMGQCDDIPIFAVSSKEIITS